MQSLTDRQPAHALVADVDYIILDGRGAAAGSAPLIFRDHISAPTLPTLARARRHLDKTGNHDLQWTV